MSTGAHALPGVSIAYDVFIPILYRAVSRGFVSPLHAHYVHQGLRWGFDLGFSPDKLPGHHYFKNYISAIDAKAEVSKNIHNRLINQKSYSLFPFDPHTFRAQLSSFLPSWCVFPLGAVPKSSEPGAFRPISDHSRTGFNDASCDDHLRHSLRSASDIARSLRDSFYMAVHDVDAAFPLLPLSPLLWPFFLFVWSPLPESVDLEEGEPEEWLHWHVCGDFGAKGLPGTFKIFFSDVVIGMARSEGALTLDMPIHVDDMAIIGRLKEMVDGEASSLSAFLQLLGTPVKETKRKLGAQRQFCIGFWWDSVGRSRTLEETKVLQYIALFEACVLKSSLSLKEIQKTGGCLQRAVLTLPPGASCLLSNLFSLSRGLLRPQARRRITKGCREDLACASRLLSLNEGKGFFSYDHFSRAPLVATDASKSSRYVGGGYLSFCGLYSWWRYGASASRKPIDTLEGDTVVRAACDLGHLWKKKLVPFAIDNQAFQMSAVKGYSKAERLSSLIRHLFSLAISFECIFEFTWISTHDNVFADALSRPDPLQSFLALCSSHSSLLPSGLKLKQVPGSGGTKALEVSPSLSPTTTQVPGTVTHSTSGPEFSSDVAGDGAGRGNSNPVALSISYPRASIYQGLPNADVKASVSAIVADRLGVSSHSSVHAARGHWVVVADRHMWPRIILADDPLRGGKLATFVSYLVYETELKATSISNYVWGLRSWFKLNFQPDPIYGVLEWDDFMQSVQVVAWCAREPRKAVPLRVIRGALESVDMSSFEEVQTALLMVMMFFSFSRSESPCPKSFTGAGSFDDTKRLMVCDVVLRVHNGVVYLAIRLKSIKQDPRMERAEASGNEDWIYIGVTDGVFNILHWLKAFWGFFPNGGSSLERLPNSPFFRDFEGQRVLTYTNALASTRRLYAKVVPSDEAATYGLHGLRVEAYNRARAVDPLLAVAHGGWSSVAHERYARFDVKDVLALPGAMLAGESQSSIVSEGGVASPLIEPPIPEVSLTRQAGPRLGRARPRASSFSSPSRRLVATSSSSAPAPLPRSRVRAGANSSALVAHSSAFGSELAPAPLRATPPPSRRARGGAGSAPGGAISAPTPAPLRATPPPGCRAPPRSRAKARSRARAQPSSVATPLFSTPEALGPLPLPQAPLKKAGRRRRKAPHPSSLPSPPPFMIGGSALAPAVPLPPAHLSPVVRNTSSCLPSMGSLRARAATFDGRYGA